MRIAILIAVMFLALQARGQVTASLNEPAEASAAGGCVLFCGTLSNMGSSAVYLNDVAFTLSGSAGTELESGSNAFYENVPGILGAGATYTGPIFSAAVASGAPAGDYTGSMTVQGGTNIFTTNALASAPFTVSSPTVSIVASVPTAKESGPQPGALAITRTGGTTTSLAVSFGIGGTAVNGTDYQTIASPVTIAAGATSAYVIITPIVRQMALGPRTVTLSLQSSAQYNLGAQTSGTVTIQDTLFNQWRLQYFGAAANTPQAASTGDWSGSGIENGLAYGLAIDPTHPSQTLLPTVSVVSNHLTLSFVPNPAATDVTYSVQASTDLINWSTTNVQEAFDSNPNGEAFQYTFPVSPGMPAVFLRLWVNSQDF